jgi:hypothetical protein
MTSALIGNKENLCVKNVPKWVKKGKDVPKCDKR